MSKNKRKSKEIIGTRIKEYKLPLGDRIAYYRPVLIWFFWLILTAMIVGPTIYKNYENLWYYLSLIPLIFFFVMANIHFVRFVWFVNRMNAKIEFALNNQSSFSLYSGAPGTGKSADAMYISHEVAKENWRELQYQVWKLFTKMRDKDFKPNADQKEIIDAYNFYVKSGGVPCWGTNIPAYSKRYKRYSYDLRPSVLKQEDRAPYKLAGVYDEIGAQITMEMKGDRAKNEGGATDVTDFCKFARHFGEFTFFGCEQDQSNVYIDFRRVVGEIRTFNGKEELLKPRFLKWVHKKLKEHFINKMRVSESVFCSKFMDKLESYIRKCGFLKFNYKIHSNTETGAVISSVDSGDKDCVYMPCSNEVVYRSRAFREAYKVKDKSIELKPWESLYMSDERARASLKSENLSKKKDEDEKKSKSEKVDNKSEELSDEVMPF